jgi:hypothetical protein
LGAAVISPAAWFMLNTAPIRSARMNNLLQRPIDDFQLLEKGIPFVLKTSLATDIETSIYSSGAGVKLIWAPTGAGKTTTVRRVIKTLQTSNKIRGAIVINPPSDSYVLPSVWFRSALRDVFGNLVNPNEKVSEILPKYDGRPFVFVLDQIDNAPMGEDMRVFIKTLAEDSHLTKLYVVLVICSDASNAKIMWDWNSHEKIVMLNDLKGNSPGVYRWDKKDIEQWLNEFQEMNSYDSLKRPQGTMWWDHLKESAIVAGTPGFLVEIVPTANANSETEGWLQRAEYKNELWKIGAKMLTLNNRKK